MSAPEIPGYQLDQQLLVHPLAELWHGRTFTGMEIVALVLTADGANDPAVLARLTEASRDAALVPGQHETPLWAANFNSARPYAITQLVPGQTGAERVVDPLDGIIGNDDGTLQAVRDRLSQYGATPPTLPPADSTYAARPADGPYAGPPAESTYAAPSAGSEYGASAGFPSYADSGTASNVAAGDPATGQATTGGVAGTHGGADHVPADQSRAGQPHQPGPGATTSGAIEEYSKKIGSWIYAVVAVVVLIVFTIAYSVGAAVGSAVKDEPAAAPPPQAVSPKPYPSTVLLPPVPRPTTAAYKRPDGSKGIFGATYPANADVQVIANAQLPFAFGWPRPPQVAFDGESSTLILRRVQTGANLNGTVPNLFHAQIALHPCASLKQCLADRSSFDQQWTKIYKAPVPATAKDSTTWLTATTSTPTSTAPYAISMTHVFQSVGQWWLVGTHVFGATNEAADIQRVVNDIWHQTS
ncbi:hypothetical protein AB0E69_12665 [Kribbella sp. NPDC026611]|uniref:hypothetical protein n=1 Tax=Kribbella sp. NPDC026611 TaxID=3154911 RepID=UPI0033E02F39